MLWKTFNKKLVTLILRNLLSLTTETEEHIPTYKPNDSWIRPNEMETENMTAQQEK